MIVIGRNNPRRYPSGLDGVGGILAPPQSPMKSDGPERTGLRTRRIATCRSVARPASMPDAHPGATAIQPPRLSCIASTLRLVVETCGPNDTADRLRVSRWKPACAASLRRHSGYSEV